MEPQALYVSNQEIESKFRKELQWIENLSNQQQDSETLLRLKHGYKRFITILKHVGTSASERVCWIRK